MGHILWGMVLMAAFGVGFSLPLGAILFGVAFGKAPQSAEGGVGNPSRRGRSACLRGILFVGNILKGG